VEKTKMKNSQVAPHSSVPKKLTIAKPIPGLKKKTNHPPTKFLTQTLAKNNFLAYCRYVLKKKEYVCVTDQTGRAFLTLTVNPVKGVSVIESAQFFKDNFARCSSLIRDGIVFRLTIRDSNNFIYARRHTSYTDPVDSVIDAWRESIIKQEMVDHDERALAQLRRDISELSSQQSARNDEDRAESRERYRNLVRGLTRVAIGHKPFEEGQARSRDPDPQTKA
jgi:hypothetical protein